MKNRTKFNIVGYIITFMFLFMLCSKSQSQTFQRTVYSELGNHTDIITVKTDKKNKEYYINKKEYFDESGKVFLTVIKTDRKGKRNDFFTITYHGEEDISIQLDWKGRFDKNSCFFDNHYSEKKPLCSFFRFANSNYIIVDAYQYVNGQRGRLNEVYVDLSERV